MHVRIASSQLNHGQPKAAVVIEDGTQADIVNATVVATSVVSADVRVPITMWHVSCWKVPHATISTLTSLRPALCLCSELTSLGQHCALAVPGCLKVLRVEFCFILLETQS